MRLPFSLSVNRKSTPKQEAKEMSLIKLQRRAAMMDTLLRKSITDVTYQACAEALSLANKSSICHILEERRSLTYGEVCTLLALLIESGAMHEFKEGSDQSELACILMKSELSRASEYVEQPGVESLTLPAPVARSLIDLARRQLTAIGIGL